MTMKTKQELIAQIAALLNEVIEVDEQAAVAVPQPAKPVEMLTIKECSEAVKGSFRTHYPSACGAGENPVHKDRSGQAWENPY